VVGASRQRAAPRSQFVGAPPARPLVRLACAVQAALWATPPGKATGAASASSVLATPLSLGLLFSCQRHKARPNMSVNRSLHGMAPWPRCAVCTSSASRPGRHAVPARLPLR
jgi:hypothetical protein